MSILRLRNVNLSFGSAPLLKNVNFNIDRRERVCLIGRNGAGKSTLLKVIAGEIAVDSGMLELQQDLKIAELSQEVPQYMKQSTVYEIVASGLGEIAELLVRYQQLSHEFSSSNQDALAKLQHRIELLDGWNAQNKIETALSKLSLNPENKFDDLSGGVKRRVLLARALALEPDLLLLDEPTNHLDIKTITWMEEFFLSYKKAILFITHDRSFLQTLATRIVELDRGELTSWDCDYQTYLKRKQITLESETKQNALFDKKLALEEKWIRQGIKARRTRNEGRVRTLKKMREERQARQTLTSKARITSHAAQASGKIVIEAKNIAYHYNHCLLIKDFSTTILRGDKIGIIGPNGCGKTTLINLLLGKIVPDEGNIKLGTNLQVAYFDQMRAQLDESKSVADNVGEGSDHVMINGKSKHIIGYLQDFLFSSERARAPISMLSGGERNRLLLAKLFTKPANLFVLDEPTNDLDVETLELLEMLLVDYTGTLLLVSHDRAFLNNVVTSTIVYENDGEFNEYVGGYDDWLHQRKTLPKITKKTTIIEKEETPRKSSSKKLNYKEQRELQQLPKQIEALEKEQEQLHDKMADPEFYQQGNDIILESKDRLESIEAELAKLYKRWEELEV